MNVDCFCVLLLSHLIGDFYLQWDELSKKICPKSGKTKDRCWVWLLLHAMLYTVVCGLVAIIMDSRAMLLALFLLTCSHLLIDLAKMGVRKRLLRGKTTTSNGQENKKTPFKTESRIFACDQLLHLACIFMISCWFVAWNDTIVIRPIVQQWLGNLHLPVKSVFLWILAIALIGKPTNIALKKILQPFKPKNSDNTKEVEKILNAGALIGFLERIIVVVLMALEQYASIGLVLTAKSIVRYNEFAKDDSFADYYLLGTLTSLLVAICAYLLFLR